jgi:hypothetical protein
VVANRSSTFEKRGARLANAPWFGMSSRKYGISGTSQCTKLISCNIGIRNTYATIDTTPYSEQICVEFTGFREA